MTLMCPKCGEPNASVSVQVATRDIFCQECDNTFDAADVRAMLDDLAAAAAKWRRVLPWVEAMPDDEVEAAADAA